MGAEDNVRITISEDRLYRALGELELRLVEKLATKSEVDDIRKDVESLKRWRAYVTGMSTTALALASACVAIVLWSLTHPH